MKLKDVCVDIWDCPHTTANDEGEGYPLIRTPNIGKGRFILSGVHRVCEDVYNIRNKRAVPQDNDLIFAREAPAGNVAIIKNGQKFCLGQRTVLIRPDKDKVNPDFLNYFLLAPEQQHSLLKTANGSTSSHVNMKTIRELQINLPSRNYQDKASSILCDYDEVIELNQRKIAVLEEIAMRIYREWLVHLRFPEYESCKFENGLPKGWKYLSVTDVLDIRYGKDHYEIEDGDSPIYGSGGIMRKGNKFIYNGKSVLIPRKGTLNNIMLVDGCFWCIDTMFYSIPRISNTANLVYFQLDGYDMDSLNSGTALPSMTTKILSGIKIIVPSEEIRRRFDDIVDPILTQISILKLSNYQLQQMRDRLLPQLMSGQL